MKKTIRLTEGDLKRLVYESLNEYYYEHGDNQLNVSELIQELQKCNPKARVEVHTPDGYKTIHIVVPGYGDEDVALFTDKRDYEENITPEWRHFTETGEFIQPDEKIDPEEAHFKWLKKHGA